MASERFSASDVVIDSSRQPSVRIPPRSIAPSEPAQRHPSLLAEPTFVTRSAAMSEMLEMATTFARLRVPILIEGATGTGKLYVAQYVHVMSSRRDAPFHWLHGATLDESLAGADLFGHAQGAFTGASRARAGLLASADGGTVFLDEIGKIRLPVQGKLLHVVEGHPYYALGEDRPRNADVRFVLAASEGLERLAESGAFLPDLYQRIKGFRIRVPSLGERREDVPDLIEQFAWLHAAEAGYREGPPEFDIRLVGALTSAPLEGNLRTLRDAVILLMGLARGAGTVTLNHCRGDLAYLVDLARARRRPDQRDIEVAVAAAGGNKSEAARALGVSRRTVQRRTRESGSQSG